MNSIDPRYPPDEDPFDGDDDETEREWAKRTLAARA
jgi:hypothetical protein